MYKKSNIKLNIQLSYNNSELVQAARRGKDMI